MTTTTPGTVPQQKPDERPTAAPAIEQQVREGKKINKTNIFDRMAYGTLLALVVLVPFVFLPFAAAPFLLTKVAVATLLGFLATGFFAIARLKDQTLRLPVVVALAAGWLIPLAYLISSLFQRKGMFSVFGNRLEVDSLGFFAVCVLVLTLVALLVNTRERVLQLFLALLASAAIVAILELLIFFARGDSGVFGVFVPSLSVIGSLNDLATFFGLVIVVALVTLTYLPLTTALRIALSIALLIGAFFLATVNLASLWWIVGLFALVLFVYSASGGTGKRSVRTLTSNISVASLIFIALSALFLFASDSVTGALARAVDIGELDVRPSWQTTVDIGATVYGENLLFGATGTFSQLWARLRPVEVEQTVFASADFTFGIGVIPTSLITTGLIGAIAWVVFLGALIFLGVRRFIIEGTNADPVSAYLRTCSFVAAVYLWIIMIIQVPSPALIVYAFVFSGLFIATLETREQGVRMLTLSFREKPKLGFVATLVLTAAILTSVSGVYVVGTRYVADMYHQRAVFALERSGDHTQAEQLLAKANTLHAADVYYRLGSRINTVQLQQILSENKPPEEIRERFQAVLGTAIANAREATTLNANNYENWVALGSIYQSIVPLGIEGAYTSAVEALDRALELRPKTASLLLAKASLARVSGNTADAKQLVTEAISVRNQYTDAIFLLAQIQIEENNIPDAIRSVEAAVLFDQQNPVGYFQLGLLRYSTEDYAGAAAALERAVALNDVYANARYFLGLSYHKLGRNDQALLQFKKVQESNPDNAEVRTIIENLSAGKEPFNSLGTTDGLIDGAAPLVDAQPGEGTASGSPLPPELTR